MASLFIDTSITLTVGILDADFNWISYFKSEDKKSSAKIHKIIYNQLKDNNLKIGELENVFGISGPGSYTGMRVTEGINQVLEMCGLRVYSFFHYQVPAFCDVTSGTWVANAYKSETFIYTWENDSNETNVIPTCKFEQNLSKEIYRPRFFSAIPDDFQQILENTEDSTQLIRSHSNLIFAKVLKLNLREKVYYYRPLAKEFKVSK